MNTNFINSYFSKKNIFAKHLMIGTETEKNVNSNNKMEQSNNYESVIKHPIPILTYFGLTLKPISRNNSNEMAIHSPSLQNSLFPSPSSLVFSLWKCTIP
jgi:hypothetical protein